MCAKCAGGQGGCHDSVNANKPGEEPTSGVPSCFANPSMLRLRTSWTGQLDRAFLSRPTTEIT